MALFGKNKNDDKQTDKTAVTPADNSSSMKDLYAPSMTSKKAGTGKKTETAKYTQAYSVLVKPLVTEKATILSAHNQYVFMVARDTNKIEIAKAINAVYHVKPISVNLINMKGKKVSRGKITGSRKDWKKAIVTLAKGQTIKVYEGV